MAAEDATAPERARRLPPTIEELLAELVAEVRELRRTVAAAGVVVGHEVAGGGSVTQCIQQLHLARGPAVTDVSAADAVS